MIEISTPRSPAAFPSELIPELLPRSGRSLEESLQRLQDEAAADPRRHQQLTAIRYYLQALFRFVSQQWHNSIGGVTNYHALLGQIRHHRKGSEPVCLVTLNYDTLIERPLGRYGMQFDVPDDYISSNEFKLFKLHGSENWGRHLTGSVPIRVAGHSNTDPWGNQREVIQHGRVASRRIRISGGSPPREQGK